VSVERFRIPVDDGCELAAVIAWPRDPVAFLIAVPVVGGTAGQQLAFWRHVVHGGVAVGSFTYRGHRGSDGTFTFADTFADTATATEVLRARAADHGLPLHMLGGSYATLPLLGNLAIHPEWGVRSFVAVSGFPLTTDFLEPMGDFFARYARAHGHGRTAADLARMARAMPEALDLTAFKRRFLEHFHERLPNVTITLDRFEALEFRRADLVGEIQSFGDGPLNPDADLTTAVPSLWIYGRDDNIMALHDDASRRDYRRRVRLVAPDAELCEADIDHWTRGPGHTHALDRAVTFILKHSRPGAPEPVLP